MHTSDSIMPSWLIWLIVIDLIWIGGFVFAALLSRATERGIKASAAFSAWLVMISSLVVVIIGLLIHSLIAIEFGGISAGICLLVIVILRSTRRHPLIPGHQYATWSPAEQRVGSLRNTTYRLVNLAKSSSAEAMREDLRGVARDYPPLDLLRGLCGAVSWATWKIINNPVQVTGRPTGQQGHNLDALLGWISSCLVFHNPELKVGHSRSLDIMRGACMKQEPVIREDSLVDDLNDLVVLLSELAELLTAHYVGSSLDSWVDKIAEQADEQRAETVN